MARSTSTAHPARVRSFTIVGGKWQSSSNDTLLNVYYNTRARRWGILNAGFVDEFLPRTDHTLAATIILFSSRQLRLAYVREGCCGSRPWSVDEVLDEDWKLLVLLFFGFLFVCFFFFLTRLLVIWKLSTDLYFKRTKIPGKYNVKYLQHKWCK